MGKRVRTSGYRTRFSDLRGLRLPLLCVFFVFGAIFGHVLPQFFGEAGELASHLQNFAAAGTGDLASASLLSVAALYLHFPLLVLLLGYCSFSAVAIPLLFVLQGFTFSFSIASLAAAFGRAGVVLALAVFGIRSILTIVCTLLLALFILERTAGNNDRKGNPSGKIIALCCVLLAIGIILELTIVPRLFAPVLEMLK